MGLHQLDLVPRHGHHGSARVAESWERADVHQLVLIDAPVAAAKSAGAPRQNHPDDGWRWINSSLVRDLFPVSWSVTEQSESKNSDHLRRLAARPLFAVVRADTRALPKVTSSDNYGGRLAGKLLVARIDTGAPVCVAPFSIESASKVKFKERGITGTSFEKAVLDDFKEQAKSGLPAAMKAVAPAFTVDVGF